MTTGNTTLLGLALPVEGELSGTWGDVVNDSITSLLDTAIAGTTTLSADIDVTLSTTALVSNQARSAIIHWTANNTLPRNIVAPSQSKVYIVINDSPGVQNIIFRGASTPGVVIPPGFNSVVAWDGTDFVSIANNIFSGGTF